MHPESDFFPPDSAFQQHPMPPRPAFEWQQEYSVGVGILDEHHRHIFHLLNRIHEATLGKTMPGQQGRAAPAFLLDELIGFICRHFAGEELLMQAFAYPESLTHELEHERLIRVLLEFRAQFADGREELAKPLLEFMEGWLIRHILTVDRRYAAFFAERGAEP